MNKILYFFIIMLVSPGHVFSEEISVLVEEERDGGYFVSGGFSTDAPQKEIWEILVDYNSIHEFVSFIQSSRLKEIKKESLLVEQTVLGRFLVFSKKVYLLLHVVEEPFSRIMLTDISKKNFEFYEGKWEISNLKTRREVRFSLSFKPDFWIPGFVTKVMMRKKIKKALKEVKAEILDRTRND